MSKLQPVVLAGGAGTRLWPLSREFCPKQFRRFTGQDTMVQATLKRLRGLDAKAPIIVCNDEHRFLAAEQARTIGAVVSALILEPTGRNTAPAIALAAHRALSNDEHAVLLVLPADHYVRDADAFRRAVRTGESIVADGSLLTFGVVPNRPETGFGYIRRGHAVGHGAVRVDRFVEKPDAATAARYVASGDYAWNSGMFMFPARVYLDELERLRPDIAAAVALAAKEFTGDWEFLRPGRSFDAVPAESVDYAVLEKTDKAVMLPIDVGWSDVGSFEALFDLMERDGRGNITRGDVLLDDTENSMVFAESRMVATIGLSDTIVVETADAVLVAARDRSQEVKGLVDRIRSAGRSEHQIHRTVYRPWGTYETVAASERYQVKRIMVNPGASLSLQMHNHRSEHWTVVRGTANVMCGERELVLHENQSTYIPIGSKHRLANLGRIPLHLIEVQVGSYLGEDDIVRFEDAYGRG